MAESIGRREHGGAVREHGALAATDHELAGLPIFADLAPDDHSTIVSSSSIVELTAGEWLFRQGEPADGLYVVRSGGWRSCRTGS
ncbi:MAG: hypothetical protein M3Z25_00330 [Actinomycetota bacterium]|nr:hypothetical protein [Actinomycetota bacterium]